MSRRTTAISFLLIVLFPLVAACATINVGDTIILVERLTTDGTDKKIPGHSDVGVADNQFRLDSNSTASVLEIGTGNKSHWLKVKAGDTTCWIISKYVQSVQVAESDGDTCIVGTWNIEWFKDGKKRGFPEYLSGGPTYESRTAEQVKMLANVIKTDVGAQLLVLTEVNGDDVTDPEDGSITPKSNEVERLLSNLPVISHAGGDP